MRGGVHTRKEFIHMKRKYVSKMLSFMLAGAMVCTSSVPAFAEEPVSVDTVQEESVYGETADTDPDEIVMEDDTAAFEDEALLSDEEQPEAIDVFDGLIEDEEAFEPAVSAKAEKKANRFESIELDGDDAVEPMIENWAVGRAPSEPKGKALYGSDTMYFKWGSESDLSYTGDGSIDWDALKDALKDYDTQNSDGGYPTEEGEYIAVAYIDETDEYKGIHSELINFEVFEATPIDIGKYDTKVIIDKDDDDDESVRYEDGNVILTINGTRIWSHEIEGMTGCVTTLEDEDYTGEEIKKTVLLQDAVSSFDLVPLTEGTDYEVTYSDNINAGEATITITGLTDGVTGTIVKTFNINKIAPTISVEPAEATGKFPNEITYTVTSDSDGEISAVSSDESIATVSVLGNTVTVTPVEPGSVTISVSQAEGTNWTASTEDVTVNAVIEKGDMVVTVPEDEERGYTGTPIAPQDVTVTTPADAVITYGESADACTNEAPASYTDVGSYEIFYKITRKGYNDVTGSYKLNITKVDNYWTKEPTIRGWGYGAFPNNPSATPAFGEVEYTYSRSESGSFTELPEVPDVGQWYVKASVEGTDNYNYLETVVPFEITTHEFGNDIRVAVDTRAEIYTGEEIKKEIIIKTGVVTLEEGKDYDVEYSDNIEVGTAKFRILFKGNYEGETERVFNIIKKPQAAPTEKNWLPSHRTETTPNSVEFTGIDQNEEETTVEYALKGWKHPWQADTKFTGLPEGRTFTVLARYAGDDNHQMSAETAIGTISTELSSWSDFFLVTGKTSGKKKIKLTWQDVKGANRYDIYGAKAGSTPVRLATVNGSTHTYKTKNLKKNKYYTYYVEARYDGNGTSKLLVKTPQIYVSLKKKVGNATNIIVNGKKTVKVKAGKSVKLNLTLKSTKSKTTTKVKKFRYYVVDPTICSVTSKGKVKGLKKGTTQIWVYANNGIRRVVNIKVK